jgi:hypothetical protein
VIGDMLPTWIRDVKKLLVDELITTTNTRHNQELRVLFYRAAVDLPRSTLNYVAGLIRRHRKKDRVGLAVAQPRAASAAGADLPAQRRDIRRDQRGVRRVAHNM